MDWINAELLPEHIVVRSLEEDIFDGLILHHLFRKSLPSAPGSPRRQSGPAWGSLGALCRALGRQLIVDSQPLHFPRDLLLIFCLSWAEYVCSQVSAYVCQMTPTSPKLTLYCETEGGET